MAYYNEIFIEEKGILKHIASCLGSDTPDRFSDVNTQQSFDEVIEKIRQSGKYWDHKDNWHPFPWSSYKTSDNLIIFKKSNRKWFEFWKPSHCILLNSDKKDYNEDTCDFADISKFNKGEPKPEDVITFTLPKLIRH